MERRQGTGDGGGICCTQETEEVMVLVSSYVNVEVRKEVVGPYTRRATHSPAGADGTIQSSTYCMVVRQQKLRG